MLFLHTTGNFQNIFTSKGAYCKSVYPHRLDFAFFPQKKTNLISTSHMGVTPLALRLFQKLRACERCIYSPSNQFICLPCSQLCLDYKCNNKITWKMKSLLTLESGHDQPETCFFFLFFPFCSIWLLIKMQEDEISKLQMLQSSYCFRHKETKEHQIPDKTVPLNLNKFLIFQSTQKTRPYFIQSSHIYSLFSSNSQQPMGG